MASIREEHSDQILANIAWQLSDNFYSCICFPFLGQQFLISSGESSLPYSQTTMLSGKLISFLGPREQHWVFHHLDHSLAYRWTPDPNRANQAQSWDLKPGSLAYWLGHDPDNDYSPVLSNLCHSVSSLPEGFVRSYTFILHSFCLFLSQTFGQDLMPVFLGFFNAEFCDFQMQSPGHLKNGVNHRITGDIAGSLDEWPWQLSELRTGSHPGFLPFLHLWHPAGH